MNVGEDVSRVIIKMPSVNGITASLFNFILLLHPSVPREISGLDIVTERSASKPIATEYPST